MFSAIQCLWTLDHYKESSFSWQISACTPHVGRWSPGTNTGALVALSHFQQHLAAVYRGGSGRQVTLASFFNSRPFPQHSPHAMRIIRSFINTSLAIWDILWRNIKEAVLKMEMSPHLKAACCDESLRGQICCKCEPHGPSICPSQATFIFKRKPSLYWHPSKTQGLTRGPSVDWHE